MAKSRKRHTVYENDIWVSPSTERVSFAGKKERNVQKESCRQFFKDIDTHLIVWEIHWQVNWKYWHISVMPLIS